MPYRRLFGLLVCALSLSSVSAVAQTVAFVHGTDDESNSFYLEETEARVRVTDPAADVSPTLLDTVSVTVTTELSGDSEVLELRETDRDSGVFEGRIKLVRNASPSQAGILETGFTAGPPAVFDTLMAQYGAATGTAPVKAVRIEILDEHGQPTHSLTNGDWVHVRLEDHVRADDPAMRDTISVLVQNPDMGDSELLTLTETARRTGVFEGRIRHLTPLSPSGDGVVGGYPFHQILAVYDVLGYPEDAEVSTVVVGSRVETLGADGRPTTLVPESSPLRLRVTNRTVVEFPGVDTADVVLHSQITGDDETVFLTETGPVTGIFEGTVPMTVFGLAQDGDGTLTTGELLGPPHSFDVVQISYTDDFSDSGTVWTSVGTYASETRFTDAEGKDAETYAAGFPAWVRVEDHNSNQPAVVDTIQATIESLTHGDSEVLVLTETGQNTGVFSGSVALDLPSGGSPGDGRLEAQEDETIRALHGDALGLTASGDLARVRTSRLQFVDEEGRPVGVVVENGMARVRLEKADCNNNPFWAESCLVTFTSRVHADEESLWFEETGEDTGVFLGEIEIPFSFDAFPSNGVLELGNSGSPEYLADEVTARAGSNFASVPAVGFTLRFINADGTDAETFSPGEAVGLRLEDHGINNSWEQQTETLPIRVFGSPEAETVQLTETGADTGVYEGTLPSRISASPSPYDGTLDVEIGSRLLVDWSHPLDSREALDEAVVSGTAPVPPEEDSPVTFRDAYGNPADSYAAGTRVWVRVEDAAANLLPTHYDFAQVTLFATASGDTETLYLRETTRDSGIFEGSMALETELFANQGDGRLQPRQGEEIEAVYGDFSDEAVIRYSSAEFIDESGEPTGEVLENGVARLRVVSSSSDSSVDVAVGSSRAGDQVSVTLPETFPGSHVYEGTVQLSFVPPGGGIANGLLETSSSGSPDYLGDELTVTYQDAEGTAVTIPSRVQFIDSFGRVVSTFAVGERVGVRVEDHNLDDPQVRDQILVLVREAGLGDADSVTLIETGYDTNVFEGNIATEDAPTVGGDGALQLAPGQVIEAERQNQHTPNPTVAQATMAGASVLFVDAEGRPAEVYLERTRAYVRVSDTFASGSVTVTLQSFLGGDSEPLTLTETGPSTGLFEGWIPLSPGGGSNPDNGYLETGQYAGPPHEYDTLTASYQSVSGTVSGTVGMIGSRTWFVDAYGNLTDGYTAGTTAYVRVEDHVADSMPGSYDYAQVTLRSSATGDTETLYLRETTRDSGIFEGSLPMEDTFTASPNDGRLQARAGDQIFAEHEEQSGDGMSSDMAMIRNSSAMFVDENGEPTGEVLENGVARLRVVTLSPDSEINVVLRSLYGGEQMGIGLSETFPGSHVYEGTVQLSFVPPGGALPGNGRLETSNSGSPDYLGDVLTLTYQDGKGTAVTIQSRVRFFDSIGGVSRVTTTFAVGERVGVRVEDNNLDDPQVRDQILVLVREVGAGDADSVTLIETGYDTNVYEGSIATEDEPVTPGDGKLQVAPGQVIEAERQNQHTPYPTVAQATMSGASVLFVDAEGRPAEVYFERTEAYVRVSNAFASGYVVVTLQSLLGLDSEFLTLIETGPSTGVFEGSIPLSPGGGANPNDGYLTTGQYNGPPHEFDTLTASYPSVSGTVSDTVGMIGSRTWFVDAYGNETDSYTVGTTAYVRVEDHVADSMPSSYDYAQVTLQSAATGDSETLYLRETTRDSGVFEGSLNLETDDHPYNPSPDDGRLQSVPVDRIEAVHEESPGDGTSSDQAFLRYSSAEFIDETGAPTGKMLENGVARLRVTSASPGSSVDVSVASSRAADQVSVTLTETSPGSQVYEGTVQLSFVPPGGGMANSLLETSNSGSPDYLGDGLTLTYQDGEGHAVTIPSRVRFFDSYGRVTTTFAVGERVGVRVEDHNLDDPQVRDQIQVLVREVLSGEADSVTLIETGYDTNVFEGSIATEDAAATPGDGTLQLAPGRVIEAERQNQHTPYPTLAQAAISGASMLFIDAQGQPAELYFEGTRAYVRVSDTFADFSPSPDTIPATLRSFLTGDAEAVSLTETGPSTGVFVGSIPLSMGSAHPGNGFLETGQSAGLPTEFDTLTASYESVAGTVSDTAGTLGSRTWFTDDRRNPTDSYATGSTAFLTVEDHTFTGNATEVTLRSLATGDVETRIVNEGIPGSGLFHGYMELQTSAAPAPGDGRLQAVPGEEIEVEHADGFGSGASSDQALIRQAGVVILEDVWDERGVVLENGVARLRVTNTSPGPQPGNVTVRSLHGGDEETVSVTQTTAGIYEGTIQLSFVPEGGGIPGNGTLETSNSGSPEYLQDELTATYLDSEASAVNVPSRIGFLRFSEDGTVTEYSVGTTIRVRVQDQNVNDPAQIDTTTALLSLAGDSESITLTETSADSGIFLGELPSSDAPGAPQDGTLTVGPNTVATVEHQNVHTPHPTTVQLPFNGNFAPQPVHDAAQTEEEQPVIIDVLANDSDPDQDPLAISWLWQGANGSVSLESSSTLRYTPDPGFVGTDTFNYVVSDGHGAESLGTVTVTVIQGNEPPVAGDDSATTAEDQAVDIDVQANDSDPEDDPLEVTLLTQPALGTAAVQAGGTILYTPSPNAYGSDTFTYQIEDPDGATASATVLVIVTPVNDPPVANDDAATVAEDGSATISVLGNDTDADNDTLAMTAVTQGTNGTVTLNPVTYTPNADFNGSDSFTYTVSDGNGGTDTATVTVTITPVNDAPAANDDTASVVEDGSVDITVLGNDADVDEDLLSVTSVTQGANGSVVINPDDTVTYTPEADFNGTDSFTYTVSDGNGGTDTATVNVTVGSANDAPVANDDTTAVEEDGSVSIPVLGNDLDLDNDTLSVTSVTQPANGTVTMNPVTYTPNANFSGTNSFTYTVSDGNGGTDTATVTVTVTAVNDAPVAVNDSATTLAETPVTIQVRTNDTDVEGATLTITAATQGAHGSVAINAGQTVTYTPATAWVGPDTFTYTVSDGAGGTATATVNVNVQAPPRVSTNIQVLYAFNEGSGTTVSDTSGVGTPLNLTVANASAVTWLPGALSIDSNTLVQSAGTATKVINASKESNEVTVEAWVDPLNLSQTGPAAIVTVSQTHTKRNVTLGQSGTAYNGQLRTSTTGQDGTQHSAANVATTNLTHVVYTRSSTGAVRIYVNGNLVTSATLTGNLSGWANYNLALGGELSGTRYWRGELHLVAIYSRALTSTEVRQNFLAGAD